MTKLNALSRGVPAAAPWTAADAAALDRQTIGDWLARIGFDMSIILSFGASPAVFSEALGEQALRPLQFHDHDWGKVDPWSLTCIAPMPPGLWTSHGQFLRPGLGRLIWSGTETAEIWPGAMDGAVRSGHRAALEALQALTQQRRRA